MSSPLLDELHWLTEALRAHVDWSRSTGSLGLPPCDETWLDQRRDHYRKTELRVSDNNDWVPQDVELRASDAAVASLDPPPAGPAREVASQPREAKAAAPSLPQRDLKPAPNSAEISHAGNPVDAVLTSLSNGVAPASPSPSARSTAAKPVRLIDVKPIILDPAQKQARLTTLQTEVQACTSCGLCQERKHPAFARGTGSSGIVFVGEGPGADEDAQGIPFVGAAGQLLDRMIGAMGLSRDDVYVCNIIKCRPPNNRKPTDDEIAACRHFVVEQLQLIEPKVIVALGATAVEGLLGLKLGITRLRGTWRLYEGRIPVMPTFHPAYLLRKPEAKREVWEDLQAVLARVSRVVPPRG